MEKLNFSENPQNLHIDWSDSWSTGISKRLVYKIGAEYAIVFFELLEQSLFRSMEKETIKVNNKDYFKPDFKKLLKITKSNSKIDFALTHLSDEKLISLHHSLEDNFTYVSMYPNKSLKILHIENYYTTSK
jgi:hypothetical protein